MPEYRELIGRFLDDEEAIAKVFATSNKAQKIGMYSAFRKWCEGKTKIKYKYKDIFFEEVLSRPEYVERECWGKECFVNMKIPYKGTGAVWDIYKKKSY